MHVRERPDGLGREHHDTDCDNAGDNLYRFVIGHTGSGAHGIEGKPDDRAAFCQAAAINSVKLQITHGMGRKSADRERFQCSAGYDNIVLLQGGTEAWEKSGFPMRRIGNAISLERQVQITIGTLLILKVVFGFTVHEVFFVLAALIGAGLITAGVTRWCGMARLIARMPWNHTRNSAGQTSG